MSTTPEQEVSLPLSQDEIAHLLAYLPTVAEMAEESNADGWELFAPIIAKLRQVST